jgi:antitoxin (DNA-binding transcriptional repressor) of toxin-antitoxin stability system
MFGGVIGYTEASAGGTAMTVSIQEAQADLLGLIRRLPPGEELVLTADDQPVAKVIPTPTRKPRKLGTLKGTVLYMAPDFDDTPAGFEEYMP